MLRYYDDYAQWAQEQADLLENQQFDELDIEGLVEELRDVLWGVANELDDYLTSLIVNLYYLSHTKISKQPDCPKTLQSSIINTRLSIYKLLNNNPSMESRLPGLVNSAYEDVVIMLHEDRLFEDAHFPDTCPFTLEQLLDRKFYPC